MDGDVQRWFAVQRFLFQEARLLDERRLDEWLALFAPEAEYWVPYAWGQASPRDHVSIVWETVPLLRMRIDRLMHDDVPMQWPASRVNHHLSNLIVDGPETDGTLTARAYLLYVEHRRDEQRFFSGRSTWRLAPAGGGFLIREKRIDLLNADQESGHLRLSVPF